MGAEGCRAALDQKWFLLLYKGFYGKRKKKSHFISKTLFSSYAFWIFRLSWAISRMSQVCFTMGIKCVSFW